MVAVSELNVYPVKGLRGFSPTVWPVEPRGLRHDRRWMLVDEEGRFLSQRNTPRMCLYRTAMSDERLQVASPSGETFEVPKVAAGERLPVTVWDWNGEAVRVSDEADAWFTRELGKPARLVHMPEDVARQTRLEFSLPGDRVGFADAFPTLVASQASLEDLNSRLDEPLPMNRFRPNIVVSGCGAWAEDEWLAFALGDTRFRAAKHCGRCQVTATNQDTAEVGQEPLRTLATFRRKGDSGVVYFGAYFVPEGQGALKVGDLLELC